MPGNAKKLKNKTTQKVFTPKSRNFCIAIPQNVT